MTATATAARRRMYGAVHYERRTADVQRMIADPVTVLEWANVGPVVRARAVGIAGNVPMVLAGRPWRTVAVTTDPAAYIRTVAAAGDVTGRVGR